eukprot:Selendium_serpulae@DN8774_c0_g1_i1.p2
MIRQTNCAVFWVLMPSDFDAARCAALGGAPRWGPRRVARRSAEVRRKPICRSTLFASGPLRRVALPIAQCPSVCRVDGAASCPDVRRFGLRKTISQLPRTSVHRATPPLTD